MTDPIAPFRLLFDQLQVNASLDRTYELTPAQAAKITVVGALEQWYAIAPDVTAIAEEWGLVSLFLLSPKDLSLFPATPLTFRDSDVVGLGLLNGQVIAFDIQTLATRAVFKNSFRSVLPRTFLEILSSDQVSVVGADLYDELLYIERNGVHINTPVSSTVLFRRRLEEEVSINEVKPRELFHGSYDVGRQAYDMLGYDLTPWSPFAAHGSLSDSKTHSYLLFRGQTPLIVAVSTILDRLERSTIPRAELALCNPVSIVQEALRGYSIDRTLPKRLYCYPTIDMRQDYVDHLGRRIKIYQDEDVEQVRVLPRPMASSTPLRGSFPPPLNPSFAASTLYREPNSSLLEASSEHERSDEITGPNPEPETPMDLSTARPPSSATSGLSADRLVIDENSPPEPEQNNQGETYIIRLNRSSGDDERSLSGGELPPQPDAQQLLLDDEVVEEQDSKEDGDDRTSPESENNEIVLQDDILQDNRVIQDETADEASPNAVADGANGAAENDGNNMDDQDPRDDDEEAPFGGVPDERRPGGDENEDPQEAGQGEDDDDWIEGLLPVGGPFPSLPRGTASLVSAVMRRRCGFCASEDHLRHVDGVLTCPVQKRYLSFALATHKAPRGCDYPICEDPTSHKTIACQLLNTVCKRCLFRGHSAASRLCRMDLKGKTSFYREMFEEYADDGLQTQTRVTQTHYGFYPTPPEIGHGFTFVTDDGKDYSSLINHSVREAAAMVAAAAKKYLEDNPPPAKKGLKKE